MIELGAHVCVITERHFELVNYCKVSARNRDMSLCALGRPASLRIRNG